ncbi:DUF1178 family protein [Limoniibacter endophyticus]|uniref:DUF1178 family protein n=1 Tax=Limoniibacter endophyticus TaxID=1565040 RepID=A0A8J3GI55_9HYPH|nr:DUF1178 family protein [Limoniibacter endophyticus]GHC76144.1 hypothetical protein GCM10010136_26570 [Limoniibacter endophyticus]
MIRFNLRCELAHEFEAWFRSGEDFENQRGKGLVTCPQCNSHAVEKALMAPSVSTGRKRETVAFANEEKQKQLVKEMQELARKMRENSDYVGTRFAEEARKMHFGEIENRSIYGETSFEEAKNLIDDGIGIVPLPPLPEEQN